MKVFITSERGVSAELQTFLPEHAAGQIPPRALNYARIVISEGTTTGVEAGILGTPCVYISTFDGPELPGNGTIRTGFQHRSNPEKYSKW
jgi:predicted glycosyltransferase